MKPASFDYARAGSVAEAVAMLAADDFARPIAGGQSLGPMLNLRLARPSMLIDIKRIPELRAADADGRVMRIGACRTHAEIEDGVIEDMTHGMLAMVAGGIAYRAVRNRGTLGGSVSHADPAADWPCALVALGATLVVHGPAGERRIAAEGFVLGAYATALQAGEIVGAIELPRLQPGARWGYYKICRKAGEFASAIGAVVLDEAAGVARVVCGAVDGPPIPLTVTAARLRDSGPEGAAAIVSDEIDRVLPHGDAIVRQLHTVAVRRALGQVA
ncbi:MAG TPA: FAD binding domain-containing protein [Acetobacteraceae bacterium]|nr:FAD binding domain-containing protein [Acetobacteraceae bacterium]